MPDDSARPSGPITPTNRPSALISRSGRGELAHSANAAAMIGSAAQRRPPCQTSSQSPPSVTSGKTSGIGAGIIVTAPSSPATQCATAKIHALDISIAQIAGACAPKGAKIAAITPAAIKADMAQAVSTLASKP